MRVWNEQMERTRESIDVMCHTRKALEDVFQYALDKGLELDSFCYVVNEAAESIVLKYAVEKRLSNHKKT